MQLRHCGGRLTLVDLERGLSIAVDFLADDALHRRHQARRRDHPLARAVGRRAPLPRVLDGTAGLGRDAFVLATLGYSVTACERSPVLCAMLADGLRRFRAAPGGATIAGDRLEVRHTDCRTELGSTPPPEVVYLDPMFPARRKSALVKKEMQLLQRLIGTDDDIVELVAAARAVATRRVVIKRPVWAAPVAEAPDFTVEGSKVRWDVYLAPPHVALNGPDGSP
jgi:16S rRNA (guanine1516-N2)-methyltransferase